MNACAAPRASKHRVYECHRSPPVRKSRQRQSGHDESDLRPDENPLSVHPIGEIAGRQREDDDRQRRRESDESERQRRVSALVELPPERNLQHLPADDAGDAPERVKPEIAVAERRVRIVCGVYLRALAG